MGNFDQKVNKFIEIFWEQNGYNKVLQGLQNTLMIAIAGLIIGIIIGTIIATVRVLPKYKTLPKVLNAICSFYVALFRGTPMVVQLLVFYYVLLPIIGLKITGVQVAMMVSVETELVRCVSCFVTRLFLVSLVLMLMVRAFLRFGWRLRWWRSPLLLRCSVCRRPKRH